MGKRKRIEVDVLDAAAGGDVVAPFVGYFAAGRSEAEGESVHAFNVLRNVKRPNQHLLYATLDGVEYKGEPHSSDDAGQLPCSHALAIYNKASGRLQLVPVAGGRIRRLEARPTALDYKPKQGGEDLDDTADARRARNKRLVASFGSTRRVRQLQSYEAGIVHSSHVSGAQAVEQAIAQAAQAAQDAGYTRTKVLEHATAASRVLPPHHPTATSGEEAYKLHEIIPDPVFKELKIRRLLELTHDTPEARERLEDIVSKSKEPAYVTSRLALLKDRKPNADGSGTDYAPAAKKYAKLLAYLSVLLRVYQSNRKRLEMDEKGIDGLANKLNLRLGYNTLAEPLLNLFYNKSVGTNQQEVYELPQAKRDLMLRYILVTALLLEKCQMQAEQFEALRAELKLTAQDIVAQFRELGAVVNSVKFGKGLSLGSDGLSESGDKQLRSFTVSLLTQQPGEVAPKTLQECFPELKVRTKAKKK